MTQAPHTKALHDYSIAETGALLRSGKVTSMALTEHAFERIKAIDPLISAFVLLTRESALAEAAAADADFARGIDKGPMQGIPHALKDIYGTAGIRTTCHSKVLIDNVPKEDSVVAAKFKAQGAVMLGKLATHEFAIGGPSFDLPFPPARNPWNPDHMPGGSSSGSGAAVAAGLFPLALGSDTGGSIRNPASCCGIVGLKPTYGLVSRRGVFPLSFTLDHVGPMTRTVADNALLLEAIAGHDPLDPGSVAAPSGHYRAALERGVRRLRIGFIRHFHEADLPADPEVAAGLDNVARTLQVEGAEIRDVRLPSLGEFAAVNRA